MIEKEKQKMSINERAIIKQNLLTLKLVKQPKFVKFLSKKQEFLA